MMTRLVILLMLACGTAAATAQRTIPWQTDPEKAVQQAQLAGRPLVVYIGGTEREDDSRVERDQGRAFKDPLVMRRAARFVCLRISRSQHRSMLKQFHFSDSSSMEMRFLTPDGQLLDSMGASGVAQPESLAQKLLLVYQAYGRTLFEKEIKPKLEDDKSKPDDLRKALRLVTEFEIAAADKAIGDLLARDRLDSGVKQAACEALAALSTKAAVDKLLERVRADDQVAQKALAKCTPVGAEFMIADLKADATPFDYLVYKTAASIAKVPKPKPERFFENSPLKLKEDEIKRVTDLVKAAAEQWKLANE